MCAGCVVLGTRNKQIPGGNDRKKSKGNSKCNSKCNGNGKCKCNGRVAQVSFLFLKQG
jgi:hypothetical protein